MTERRGLWCPKCKRPVDSRYVAKSYPMDGGGQRRERVCKCGADVASIEWVVGVKVGPMLLITGLDVGRRNGAQQKQVQAVRAMVESLGGRCVRL